MPSKRSADATGSGSAPPPHVLREYALLADGERGALVGPRGEVAWMCVPRWHSDPLFAGLLAGGGRYVVAPAGGRSVWGGFYEEGSLVWNSRWATTDGIVGCREALAMPGDPYRVVLLRRVTAVERPARVRVLLDLRGGPGRRTLRELACEDGRWTARVGGLRLRWSGAEGARVERDGSLTLQLELADGAGHDLVLEIADDDSLGQPVDAATAWKGTEASWAASSAQLDAESVLATRDAHHALAVLRGLTSRTNGMVAAATLGLPERADVDRNYDYRYCWIRDQCFAGHAASASGAHGLVDAAVSFVSDRILADGPELKPAYTVDGHPVPAERILEELAGYPGGEPRMGNQATTQFQLDALGESLSLFGAAAGADRLDRGHWDAVETAVAAVERRWTEPDAGIWELDDEWWTHSRLMCVAGLKSVARSAPPRQSVPWSGLADAIMAEVASTCVHASGRWKRSPNDDRVDASLLLPAIRGAVAVDDPRSVATTTAVARELGRDGYVYRYRHDERPLEDSEGAFLMCGFLMAMSDHQQGRDVQARAWFERNRAACGPPGLFTEEYDVVERQLRGNIPQAFVHALLLESATTLGRAGEG